MNAASDSDQLLSVSDLGVSYGGHVAVAGVSFDVAAGEVVALIGPNGAGKSSLMRAIAGLQSSSGAHSLHGVERRSNRVHPSIAYVSQRTNIRWDFPITAFEIVLGGRQQFRRRFRRWSNEDHAVVERVMTTMGVFELSARPIATLSGGQAQRVLLARALAQQPEVLLLDEPLTGLDRSAAEGFVDAIELLAQDGLAVLCALHDIGMARRRFDRAIGISQQVVFDGVPRDVLDEHNVDRLFSEVH